MMTMIMMMMMISERINCVKPRARAFIVLGDRGLGQKLTTKASPHAGAGRASGQTSHTPYIQCDIFPDTDQLCLSEGIRPSSETKVGRLTALTGEMQGLLSNWRIRQSELKAVSCQRLALKGDFSLGQFSLVD